MEIVNSKLLNKELKPNQFHSSLNYSKMNEAVKKFFPGRSQNETKIFISLVESLQNFDFESFNELDEIQWIDTEPFDHINITELIIFVSLFINFRTFDD